jgi:hypothetical protein
MWFIVGEGSDIPQLRLGQQRKKKQQQALDSTLNKIMAVPLQRPSLLIVFF